MTSSLGVAVLLVCLGMTKYAESACGLSLIRNARTERSNELNYVAGETVLTTCFPGYATDDLQLEFTRTCQGNGQWLPALQCNPVSCTGLPVVEGADVLSLSGTTIVDNEYPVLTITLVLCPAGMATERGRIRYVSQCAYTGGWNDTSPCSVNLNPDIMVYAMYGVQLVESSTTYTPALGDPTSTQAQALAESLGRALFPVFEAEFGASYIGARDFVFSDNAGGVAVDFTMLFLPSFTMEPDMLQLGIISALDRNNFQQPDPNTGTQFTFERNSLGVSQDTNQFSREATIGLSIAGVGVAILLFTLIILCCCCRQNTKPFSTFKAVPDTRQPSMPYASPPAAVMSPYAQLGDIPYRV